MISFSSKAKIYMGDELIEHHENPCVVEAEPCAPGSGDILVEFHATETAKRILIVGDISEPLKQSLQAGLIESGVEVTFCEKTPARLMDAIRISSLQAFDHLPAITATQPQVTYPGPERKGKRGRVRRW